MHQWEGIDDQGLVITGEVGAANVAELIAELQRHKITLLKIKKNRMLMRSSSTKIKTPDLADFFREFATLITANIPIIQALTMMARDCEKKPLAAVITALKNSIEQGQTLSASLKKYPQVFNEVNCALVNVGERTGTLEVMLKYLADHLEQNASQRQRIIKALFYPALVAFIALIVTSVLLIFVVPQFQTMFANFGASLPWYTQELIYFAAGVKNYGLVIIGGVVLGFVALKIWQRHSPILALKIDQFLLVLPLINELIKKYNLAQISRTTGLAFQAGMPLLEALTLTAATIKNRIYRSEVLRIVQQITQGISLPATLSQNPLFPSRVVQLIVVGEESGTLDEMLQRITEHYETELKNITEHLNSLLEPLITIILGIIIGGLVIGMYLPIFSLGKII